MNITQDYFDELCIENYEMLFCLNDDDDDDININNNDNNENNNDYGNDDNKQHQQHKQHLKETQRYNEVVNETIQQLTKLQSQTQSQQSLLQQKSLLQHLTLTYPQSIDGIKIRHERNEFQISLKKLNDAVVVNSNDSEQTTTTTLDDELILQSIHLIKLKLGISNNNNNNSNKSNDNYISKTSSSLSSSRNHDLINDNNNDDMIDHNDDDDADNNNNNINNINNIMYQHLFIVEDGFNIFWSIFEICVKMITTTNNIISNDDPHKQCIKPASDGDLKNQLSSSSSSSKHNNKMMIITDMIIEIFNELLLVPGKKLTKKETTKSINNIHDNIDSNDTKNNNDNNESNITIHNIKNNRKTNEKNNNNNNNDQILLLLMIKHYQKSISNQRCFAWLLYYQYHYQNLISLLLYHDDDDNNDNIIFVDYIDNNNNNNNNRTIESVIYTLISLLRLAYTSCRKCEMNKNIWMNISSLLKKSLSIDDNKNDNTNINNNNNDQDLTKKSINVNNNMMDFITLLLQTISLPVPMGCDNISTSKTNAMIIINNIKMIMMDLKIHVCQLITVLCTFDEFNNTSNNNNMVAQSSHQNVLRFYESNIILILYHNIIYYFYDIFIEKSNMLITKKHSTTTSSNIESLSDNNNEEKEEAMSLSWIIRILSSGILTLRSLAIQDDVIKSMLKVGLVDTIIHIFIHSIQHQTSLISSISSSLSSAVNDSTSSNNIINNNGTDNNNNNMNMNNTKGDDQQQQNIDQQHHEIKDNNQITNQQQSKQQRQQFQDLMTSILGLLRNLAANDEMKCIFCQGTKTRGIDYIATTATTTNIVLMYYVDIVMKQYIHIPLLQEHSIGLIASVALRQPINCTILVKEIQIHESILHAMEYYPNYIPLQRQGALAIRNLVSRNPELRSIILGNEVGSSSYNTEYILRHISSKHIQCQDEVYSALRDLGLSVSSIHIERDNTTGEIITIQKNRQMFGDPNSNTNFNPVY